MMKQKRTANPGVDGSSSGHDSADLHHGSAQAHIDKGVLDISEYLVGPVHLHAQNPASPQSWRGTLQNSFRTRQGPVSEFEIPAQQH